MNSEERDIQLDRMRFTKNTAASRFAILAIVFDVLFFICLYESDVQHQVGDFYYKARIGASIICNLLFMLITFLCSEGVKNYKTTYAYVLLGLGVLQIVRIFLTPTIAHGTDFTVGEMTKKVMETPQYIREVIYLALSAASCFLAGVIGISKARKLEKHIASLPDADVKA